MKHFILKLCLLFIVQLSLSQAFARYIYVPFDESMQRLEGAPISERYSLYKRIYEEINPDKIPIFSDPKIPKIIHQIWLGSYKLPKDFIEYGKQWQALHPDWEYKLWRDEDVEKLDFPDKDLYDKASSYQEKAAILKYNILKKFGGLYVDVDYKPIRRFDYLNYTYQFYTGILPPKETRNNVQVSNSIIGSVPNNRIINETLREIRHVWDTTEKEFIESHQKRQSKQIAGLYKIRIEETFNRVLQRTITYVDRAIVLPPTYLNIIVRNKILDPYLEAIGINKRERYYYVIHRETLAAERKDGTRIIENLSQIKIEEGFFKRNYNKFKNIILDLYHNFSY